MISINWQVPIKWETPKVGKPLVYLELSLCVADLGIGVHHYIHIMYPALKTSATRCKQVTHADDIIEAPTNCCTAHT